MKVIAFYLPQFHEIEENDQWWGKGFTEWTNVKKAKPLYDGHNQPRVPLDNNYYCLLDDDVKKWQVQLAKKNNIYGFCMYHYWFNGHLLLEKPVEQYLANKELDLPFCICWANENWTNRWKADGGEKILISQTYGDRNEWRAHFNYLLPFFKDERYIKENNKPLLVVYRPDLISNRNEIFDFWNELAIENGFDGIVIANQFSTMESLNYDDTRLDYHIEYQPICARRWKRSPLFLYLQNIKRKVMCIISKLYKKRDLSYFAINLESNKLDYDKLWNTILKHKPESKKCIPGAFVDWDNTPRSSTRGSSCYNASPEKFEKYFRQLVDKARNEYYTDYIFIFAWNEWAEGGYLEPDEKNKYGYLEAIRRVLE